MPTSTTAFSAHLHLSALGSKTLSNFLKKIGPIEIPSRYGDDALLGLLRIIVGQQLSDKASRTIWIRLIDRYPHRVDLLDALGTNDIVKSGLSESKRQTLREIVILGDKWLDNLTRETENSRTSKLLDIWGLGPWSAAMWELFVLKSPDKWADNDLILRRVSQSLADSASIEREILINSAAPFRSFLSLYCWMLNDYLKIHDL